MKFAVIAILAAVTGCSVTYNPDGSKSVIVDGKQIAEIINASAKAVDLDSDK